MTAEDADYLAELEAKLTPDLDDAMQCLINAGPHDATNRELSLLLIDRFPELAQKNKVALAELGLAVRILEAKRADRCK